MDSRGLFIREGSSSLPVKAAGKYTHGYVCQIMASHSRGGERLTWRDVETEQQADFPVQIITVQSVWEGD